jgi:hypothetical protein
VIVAGCGGTGRDNAPDAKPAANPSAAPAGTGTMTFNYEGAESADAVHGRGLMTTAKLLEGLTQNVNDILTLPVDIAAVGTQCGEANAYYSPDKKQISNCYEEIDDSYKLFAADGDGNPMTSAADSEMTMFYHELGHALIDVYNLPFTGREEDVADQLSAFILL